MRRGLGLCNNGCMPCESEEEQEQDVEVTLRFDGTLSAPGTALDGVGPQWLTLVADYRRGDFLLRERCAAITLHLSTDVSAFVE